MGNDHSSLTEKIATKKTRVDSPGIIFPPPLIYATLFVAAILLQYKIPIDYSFFKSQSAEIAGILLFVTAAFFIFRSLTQFIKTRNTVITFKPAKSLQTTGIYSVSRNPMYTGLVFVYLALTCFIGNWWNIILLPLLFIIVKKYLIKREEQYLIREFGNEYITYQQTVRRWL